MALGLPAVLMVVASKLGTGYASATSTRLALRVITAGAIYQRRFFKT